MMNFETKTDLMKHQIDAVKKVLPSRVGALFMEMGTGKSRTAIELVKIRQHKIDHVVWLCPVALKETVRQEILKHTDCSDICVFDNKINDMNFPVASWYIIGIESMSSSDRVVLTVNKIITDKTMVILDESSYIKGHRSRRTERITFISKISKYRLILTGTPLSQGVVDLFAQMRFLSPKILGYTSFYSFAANHLEYSDKFPGLIVRSHNTKYLAAKIQPYTYQVTKKECLDLPKKLFSTRYLQMTDEQDYYYQAAKQEIFDSILDDQNDRLNSIAIFRLFTALQEILSGFWNRNGETIEFDQKRIAILMDVIQEIPEDEKIIIFAKFHYDINNIRNAIEAEYGSESVSVFTGKQSEKQRIEEVSNFRTSARFFVTTQSCGGHGLTLNESHCVIFYNNGFKYSERNQAEDRCHRIGQDQNVTYVDIHCTCSIDDRIRNALDKKGNTVRDFRQEVDKVRGKKTRMRELIKAL